MRYDYRYNPMTGRRTRVLIVDENCMSEEDEGNQLVDTMMTDQGETVTVNEHAQRMREANDDE